MIFDGLAKNQREGVPIAIPRRRRPLAFDALLKQPPLNVFACDSFRGQFVEVLPDDMQLDNKLVVMLRRVALFGKELGLFGQFSKRDSAGSQDLRELLAQQLFVLALRQQRDRVAPASALLRSEKSLAFSASSPNVTARARRTSGSFLRSSFSCLRFASSVIASLRRPHFSQRRLPWELV